MSNTRDLVSIVMPSYNTGKFIKESIDSVLVQTYDNWELLIIDDCSSDESIEVIKHYDDSRIKLYINDINSGAAISRNKALKEAKGKYIAFLDSDDVWSKDKLEKQIKYMQENNYDFTYHNYEKIDEESKPLNVIVTGPKKITKRKLYCYDYAGCLTIMYNSERIGLIQIEDIRKNNDYAFELKAIKKANCYLLDENLAKYRIRTKSISHDKLSKKLKSHYDLFHICEGKNGISSIWYACWNMFFGVIKKIKYEKKI